MTVDSDYSSPHTHSHRSWSWQRLVAIAGLPCLISVAALDPGNLEVDLQAGNRLGYRLLWVLLFSSILGCVLQTLAAHLTILSGSHLAELFARVYRPYPFLLRSLFVIAEISIISFDVAEVVGTAFALQLLFGWPLWFGMLMSAVDTMLVLYLQRRGMSKIELVIEGMLFILAACMFYELILSRPAIAAMLQGTLVPTLGEKPREGVLLAIGILGSIVMSHNLFLHSWLLKERFTRDSEHTFDSDDSPSTSFVEEQWAKADVQSACHYASVESAAIFIMTFVINGCVLSVTAAFPHDTVAETIDIGLKNAGALLQNVLGSKFAPTAWAIGLLSSGHAATVTGALASQAVCEGFLGTGGDTSSPIILGSRVVAILPALVAALVAGEKGSDHLIVLSQVALSLSLPFTVIPMLKILSEHSRKGQVNRSLLLSGYAAFALLLMANVFALVNVCIDLNTTENMFGVGIIGALTTVATCLLIQLALTPITKYEVEDIHDMIPPGESIPLLRGQVAEP